MAEHRQYTEEEAEQILRLAARSETGGISRDRLASMAAELGVSPDQLERAEREFLQTRQTETERKEFETHVFRDLWSHVAIYVAVNVGLIGMDLIPDGHWDWAHWPLLGWGIGVACHVASVFWSSADDEAKAFREWKAKRTVAPLSDEQRRVLDEIALSGTPGTLHAIKDLRDRLGLGLREAKDAVDQYEEIHPGIFRGG
ncbi:MAG: 2TM domain-containing protein [Fimbriimonas sp.]